MVLTLTLINNRKIDVLPSITLFKILIYFNRAWWYTHINEFVIADICVNDIWVRELVPDLVLKVKIQGYRIQDEDSGEWRQRRNDVRRNDELLELTEVE